MVPMESGSNSRVMSGMPGWEKESCWLDVEKYYMIFFVMIPPFLCLLFASCTDIH